MWHPPEPFGKQPVVRRVPFGKIRRVVGIGSRIPRRRGENLSQDVLVDDWFKAKKFEYERNQVAWALTNPSNDAIRKRSVLPIAGSNSERILA